MGTVNRRIELLLWLYQEKFKAKKFAEHFGCSVRVVQRDIDYLKDKGYDIISEVGKNGGYHISNKNKETIEELVKAQKLFNKLM